MFNAAVLINVYRIIMSINDEYVIFTFFLLVWFLLIIKCDRRIQKDSKACTFTSSSLHTRIEAFLPEFQKMVLIEYNL